MKKNISRKINKIYYLVILFLLATPSLVFADISFGTGGNTIQNPIKAQSINQLIEMILKVIIAIGTPIAVLFLIFAGFKFVTAQGKPDALKDAKTTFVWTLVGIAILLGASVLAAVISGTITQLGAGI